MTITSEKQLQAACVQWFSHTFPDKYMAGQLWATNNNTYSGRHGMAMRAIGLVTGVSDLIYFDLNSGGFVAIELKLIGKKHNKDHVRQQVKWGKMIEQNGGKSFFVTSLEGFQALINHHAQWEGEFSDVGWLRLKDVQYKLNQSKIKTVEF